VRPAWPAGRTWYHVHALAALGCERANPDPFAERPLAHRLARLEPWLDHVARLGCGGLLLTPIFASLTHGYDTVDPFRIDPRLGDEDDFRTLVDACRARDLRLVLDGVFNHVSRAFPPFADVLRERERSSQREWFRLDFGRGGADGFAYHTFEGHPELVALDHRSEIVLRWAISVATHWLARGADGWRLDAAYAVPPAFWSAFTTAVRARFSDAFLFGEMIHGDYAAFVAASGLDAVTQYELQKAIWSSLNDVNFFELSWALERHARFCRTFVPVTFVGNHDVTRIRSRLRDPSRLPHALAVLFTLPGTPCIYYGDELGMRGVKEHRAGGDDAIRPPLPHSPGAGDPTILELHRRLVAIRRERPWLTTADVAVESLANAHVQYVVSAGDRALLVRLNAGDRAVALPDGARAWRSLAGAPPGPLAPGAWAIMEPTC